MVDLAAERAELAAMRVQWGGAPGASVRRLGGLHVFASPGPAWLRQVCGLGFEGDGLDEALAAVPDALVAVVDGLVDDAVLAARGLTPTFRLRRLVAVPGSSAPRAALRLEAVDRAAAEVVSAVAGEGFGIDAPHWWAAPLGAPGWTQLVAHDGDVAVATGALHVQGRWAWVGAAATVRAARGRGAQTALLAERLRRAHEQGALRVSVKAEPGSPSYRNLLRAGFRDVHGLTQWRRG